MLTTQCHSDTVKNHEISNLTECTLELEANTQIISWIKSYYLAERTCLQVNQSYEDHRCINIVVESSCTGNRAASMNGSC
jgi:hypothetical protein